MKTISIDDELYQYIASNTQAIGENTSTILRRLLNFPQVQQIKKEPITSEMLRRRVIRVITAVLKVERLPRKFSLTTSEQPLVLPKQPSKEVIEHIIDKFKNSSVPQNFCTKINRLIVS